MSEIDGLVGTDALKAAKALEVPPVYKVHVGPTITEFPIPDSWLPNLGFKGTGEFNIGDAIYEGSIVARIRTVRYGDPALGLYDAVANPGGYVDFNVAPFAQALPAIWMDTITSHMSFERLGDGKVESLISESIYNGFKKNMRMTNPGIIAGNAVAFPDPAVDALGNFPVTKDPVPTAAFEFPAVFTGAITGSAADKWPFLPADTWDGSSELTFVFGAPDFSNSGSGQGYQGALRPGLTLPTGVELGLADFAYVPSTGANLFTVPAGWAGNFALGGVPVAATDRLVADFPVQVFLTYRGDAGDKPPRSSYVETFTVTVTRDYGIGTYFGFFDGIKATAPTALKNLYFHIDDDTPAGLTTLDKGATTLTGVGPITSWAFPGLTGGTVITAANSNIRIEIPAAPTLAVTNGGGTTTNPITTPSASALNLRNASGQLEYHEPSGDILADIKQSYIDSFRITGGTEPWNRMLTATYPATVTLDFVNNNGANPAPARSSSPLRFNLVMVRDYARTQYSGFVPGASVVFNAAGLLLLPVEAALSTDAIATGNVSITTAAPQGVHMTFQGALPALTGADPSITWTAAIVGGSWEYDKSSYDSTASSVSADDLVWPTEFTGAAWTYAVTYAQETGALALRHSATPSVAAAFQNMFPTAGAANLAGDTVDLKFTVRLTATYAPASAGGVARATTVDVPVVLTLTKA